MKINVAGGTKPGWILWVSALMIVAAGALAFSQNAPASLDSSQVIPFLNQTIDWYRNVTVEQRAAVEPDDVAMVSDNGRMADQIVRLAFDFARAEAATTGPQGKSPGSEQDQNIAGSSQYSALLELQAKVDKQTEETHTEVDSLRQKTETATGKKRQELQSQLAEIEGELELATARRDQIHSMVEFLNTTSGSSNGLGATGLRAQIQALADSVPAASAPSNSSEASFSSQEQLHPVLPAPANKPAPSGIWDLTADLFALSQKLHSVDAAIAQTKALATRSKEIRKPLVSRLKELTAQGDELGKEADSANQSTLQQEKQQLDALTKQFKQMSAAAIPLAKQGILLDLYQKSLINWESSLRSRRSAQLKGLLIRLTFLALILGVVVAAAELWRRAVYRYVHERRRRYQFLLLRKFVLWFVIAIIIAFAFASRLGSVVTFAGLITAGVAVALQNVILSIVGYFFLIGKYGVRVGDRVQIGGVTGEVIEVGLVRLHLMELSGGDYIPTGRVVAFSNSIVFQPTAGVFKQIPGTNFLWHQIAISLSPDTDYASVKQRLLKVVEAVLADYRDGLERQYRAMQTTQFSTSADAFQPKAQLRFTPSAIEIVIRYPVDRQQASEIDERVTRELVRELDHEPKLKLASPDTPSVAIRTDLAA
jgi:small-conductance mechanosensitive channel